MSQDEIAREYDVFLSYAHLDADHDAANARSLAKWLEGLGYSVWWDRSLIAGQKWPKELEIKVRASKRVIVLWSPRAAVSDWVKFETNLAANEDKLVPLIVERCPTPSHWSAVQQPLVSDFEAQKAEILRVLAIEPSGTKAREAKDDARVSIAALPTASGALIGRDIELTMLQKAWASTAPGAAPEQKTNIVVLHAIGGAGKTALMRHFVDELADEGFAGAYKVYGWSAYSQGSGDNKTANADEFIAKALGFFGHDLAAHPIQDAVERGRKLAKLVGERRSLLILDGLEPLQDPPLVNKGRLKDRGLAALIAGLAAENRGLLLITSRQELPELEGRKLPRIISRELNRLDKTAGVALLSHLGVHGRRSEMEKAVEEVLGHALSLNLLGTYLDAVHGGDVNQREQFKLGEIEDAPADFIGDQTARYAKRAARIMEGTIARFEALTRDEAAAQGKAETAILHMVGLFDRPAEKAALEALLAEPAIPGLTDAFHFQPALPLTPTLSQREREQGVPVATAFPLPEGEGQGEGVRRPLTARERSARWAVAVDRLRKLRLLNAEDPREPGSLDAHPIVRAHFGSRLQHRAPEAFREAHSRL
ncbi:MAG: TIR domain-containing protein, partial [Rhodomicrobium sp.]